jgi:hypothetical protein
MARQAGALPPAPGEAAEEDAWRQLGLTRRVGSTGPEWTVGGCERAPAAVLRGSRRRCPYEACRVAIRGAIWLLLASSTKPPCPKRGKARPFPVVRTRSTNHDTG